MFVHSSGSRLHPHCYKISMPPRLFARIHSSDSRLQLTLLQIHALIPVYARISFSALLEIRVLSPVYARIFFRPQDYIPHCYKSVLWSLNMVVHSTGSRFQLHCYRSMLDPRLCPHGSRLQTWARTVTNTCFYPRLCPHVPQAQDFSRTVTNPWFDPRLCPHIFQP
jgi:hypothetical protein